MLRLATSRPFGNRVSGLPPASGGRAGCAGEEGKGRLVRLAGFLFAFRAKMGGVEQRDFPLSVYKQSSRQAWQNLLLRKQFTVFAYRLEQKKEFVCFVQMILETLITEEGCLNLELLLGQEFAV